MLQKCAEKMKILLSADFEGNFDRLFQLALKADICICCGDVFNYHQYPGYERIRDFDFPIPFFSVKGNKEIWGKEKLHRALESTHNFFWLNEHLDGLEESTGLRFFGIDYLREPTTIPKNIDVIVSHEPAFGLADQCSDPFHAKMIPHCGSKALRRLVDRYPPEILVAGHVHHFQQQRVVNTLAITLSAALSDPIAMISRKKIKIL
ncbi:MAG: metallophosphoesterase family protein [Candidatus Hodarchaeales archaeon]|jgi:Icc-related predicted phosphoesterase